MTDWHTTPPPNDDIVDVTLLITRIRGKPFRMLALGIWRAKRGKWEIEPQMLSDGEVIAWTERREPYAGPLEMTEMGPK